MTRELEVDPTTLTSAAAGVEAARDLLASVAQRARDLAAVPMDFSFPAAEEGVRGAQMWDHARRTFADGLTSMETALAGLHAGLAASAAGYLATDQEASERVNAAGVDLAL